MNNEIIAVVIMLFGFGILFVMIYFICSMYYGIKDYFRNKRKIKFYTEHPKAYELDDKVKETQNIQSKLWEEKRQLKEIITKYYNEERMYLPRKQKQVKDESIEQIKIQLNEVSKKYDIALAEFRQAWKDREEYFPEEF